MEFYKVSEVADRCGVSRMTITRWCRTGVLPFAVKYGQEKRVPYIIPKPEFDRWYEEFYLPRPGKNVMRRPSQSFCPSESE